MGSTIITKESGLPGGEIGMYPYLILLIHSASCLISLITSIIINLRFQINITNSVIINQIIYLIISIVGGFNPIGNFVDFWTILLSFIITIVMYLLCKKVQSNQLTENNK